MNDLQIIIEGTSKIHDIDIPNIYGGFGKDQKAISDKTIAELHNKETKHVRELIKNNIIRFEENIDFIDLLSNDNFKVVVNDLGLKGSNRTKNIYLLSKRGYMKLIKIMDTDLAWEIYNEILEEYFGLKESFEIEQSAEMRDRIQNGFNYKEVTSFIDDGYTVKEFELELSEWININKYPKPIIRDILKTTDNDMNKILNSIKDRPETITYTTKVAMKQFFEENGIAYKDIKGGYAIGKYDLKRFSVLSEKDVIYLVLQINTDEARKVRNKLTKHGYMRIEPIKCLTIEEEAKKYYEMYIEVQKKNGTLEDTINKMQNQINDLKGFEEMFHIAQSKLEDDKKESYDQGYKDGLEQAKKEGSIFNRLKKWVKNKLGGDENQRVEEKCIENEKIESSKTEINEYGDTTTNRIEPKAEVDTSKIGKPQPIYKEKTKEEKLECFIRKTNNSDWMTLRLDINRLVENVGIIQNKPDSIWGDMHRMISQTFRNGKYIPSIKKYIRNKENDSKVNSYKLEELKYLSIYCYEIILEDEENRKNPAC